MSPPCGCQWNFYYTFSSAFSFSSSCVKCVCGHWPLRTATWVPPHAAWTTFPQPSRGSRRGELICRDTQEAEALLLLLLLPPWAGLHPSSPAWPRWQKPAAGIQSCPSRTAVRLQTRPGCSLHTCWSASPAPLPDPRPPLSEQSSRCDVQDLKHEGEAAAKFKQLHFRGVRERRIKCKSRLTRLSVCSPPTCKHLPRLREEEAVVLSTRHLKHTRSGRFSLHRMRLMKNQQCKGVWWRFAELHAVKETPGWRLESHLHNSGVKVIQLVNEVVPTSKQQNTKTGIQASKFRKYRKEFLFRNSFRNYNLFFSWNPIKLISCTVLEYYKTIL